MTIKPVARCYVVTCGRLLALILALLVSPDTFAQRNSRTIMRGNPDGTHEVLLLTSPDYFGLRTPDFTVADLPIIKRALVLSDEQTQMVRQQIDQYLTNFRSLTTKFAEAVKEPKAEFIPEGEEKTEPGKVEDPASSMDVELDDLNLPSNVEVSMGMSTSRSRSDDPNVPDPPPEVEVVVILDSPEGDEIPQEIIDTIRQRANVAAGNIVKRMMADEAARKAGETKQKPLLEVEDNFDTIKALHDALLEQVDGFLKDKASLRNQFVLEVQAILSEEQIERWPALERALYRQRSLPKGQLPGESVDLMDLLDKQRLSDDQRQSIAADLEAFEIALDSALRQRDAIVATATPKIEEAIANKKADFALTLTDRVTSTRLAVRAINHNHIEQFAEALAEKGQSFRAAALKLSYPRVYAETRGMKMFKSLAELDDLDKQSSEAIAALHASYESELANINQQLRSTTDRETADGARRGIEHLRDSIEGRPSKTMEHVDPIRPLLIKRAELDDHYLKLVGEVVGPERASALPKPRKNRDPIRIESDSNSSS